MRKKPVQSINELFEKWSGKKADSIVPLPDSGSYRQYFRVKWECKSILGVFNSDLRENRAFIYLADHLKQTGNRVPKVLAEDDYHEVYLEEDFGDITLIEYLNQIKDTEDTDKLTTDIYKKVIDAMPGIQVDASQNLDYSVCYPRSEFDAQSMLWDMNYFKYCLLKPLKIGFYEQDLEDDFEKITRFLLDSERKFFMFRDFQSRNIMLFNDNLYFIDFQGGRKGPLQYDLASLLFEAKTDLSNELRLQLLDYYLVIFENKFNWFNREDFLRYYYGFVYLRLMQAMGAYGFRGYIEHKPLFLQSLPLAVKTLEWLQSNHPLPLDLSSLPNVFDTLINLPKIKEYEIRHDLFTVSINSFSFKNGIPVDNSGNGGGFVFDCRALNNPGRQDEFKNLTGKDKPVIQFLDNQQDVNEFFSNSLRLIEQAVKVYLNRGFKNLMVSYGCTGGQHRSVYMADKLGELLKKNYPLQVIIHHIELEKTIQHE